MHEKAHRNILKNRCVTVDVLAIFFGIGAWVGINGIFIQLPILVEKAPEGWSLPSYLSVMVQIGNLGPLAYTCVQKFSKKKKNDSNIIYGLLAIGTTAVLLCAFFHSKTAVAFGNEHSVALFVLTFFIALNCCTSSVLYMPYMGRFKEIYLVTYFIGEGLSGLLPSVVALIQGVGGTTECVLSNTTESGEPVYVEYTPPPRFGIMEFFLFLFALMVCSCIGFTLLDRLKLAKTQYANVQVTYGNNYVYEQDDKIDSSSTDDESQQSKISKIQYGSLMTLMWIISFFANGMFNSIQSYSSLPYGGQAYHLAATLSVIANPAACFLAIFLPHTSLKAIITLTGIASILTVYVFITASMSPLPPLHDTTVGAVIVVAVWTILTGLVSYTKLCITTVMRAQGGTSLVWVGGLTQLGSFVGAFLIFILINFTQRFEAAYNDACSAFGKN